MAIKRKAYYKPGTPLIRAIGDALLWSSSAVTTYAILNDSKAVALVFLGVGIIGKAMTNFVEFSKEEADEEFDQE